MDKASVLVVPAGPGPPVLAYPSPIELLGAMRGLRLWAGQPSLRRLRLLGGTTIDSQGRMIDALPETTISYVLRGTRLPRAEFFRAFVQACLRQQDLPPAEVKAHTTRWHDFWLAVRCRPDQLGHPRKSAGPDRSS